MALCEGCGTQIGLLNTYERKCGKCFEKSKEDRKKTVRAGVASVDPEVELRKEVERSPIIMTTEMQPSLEIVDRISIVTAECAFGMHLFKDLFAKVRDIVGGRSKAVEQTLQDGRDEVLYELKKNAHQLEADAVVGVSINYQGIGDGSSNMLLVTATGTAVKLHPARATTASAS